MKKHISKKINDNEVGRTVKLYTIFFIITSLIVFSQFIIQEKLFIWNIDGFQLHFPIMYDLRENIINMIRGNFSNIPTWSWQMGLGVEYIYLMFYDIFNILAIFFPRNMIGSVYSATVILRLYLSGLFLILYVKEFDVDIIARVAGALIYSFCGFLLFAAVRHPFFINPVVILPLVLLGIEKIIRKENPNLFIFSVMLATINQYYFLYMIAMICIIYTIIRYYDWYDKINIKSFMLFILKVGLCAIIGVLCAGIVLLPMIAIFFNSNRSVNTDINLPILYSFKYYSNFIKQFIATGYTGSWTRLMFSSITWLMLSLLLFKKQNQYKLFKRIIVVTTIMLLIPIIGFVMNAFNGAENRWGFAYAFFVAVSTSICLNDRDKFNVKDFKIMFISIVMYISYIFISGEYVVYHYLIGIIFLLVFYIILIVNKYNIIKNKKIINYIILGLICINIGLIGNGVYSKDGLNYIKEFSSTKNLLVKFDKNNDGIHTKINNNSEEFYRVEQTNYSNGANSNYSYMVSNDGLINNMNIIGNFNNTQNKYTYKFFLENQLNMTELMVAGLDQRAALNSLLSAKYQILNDDNEKFVPYGYEKIKEKKNTNLYENKYVLPIGFVYDKYISRNEYEKQLAIDKGRLLLQGVVLDDISSSKLEQIDPNIYSQNLDYKIIESKNINVVDNTFKVNKDGGEILIETTAPQNSELYIGVAGVHRDNSSKDAFIDLSIDGSDKKIKLEEKSEKFKVESDDRVVYMGYTKENEEKKEIKITFDKKGKYSFDSFYIKSVSMDNYEQDIMKLKEKQLNNIKFTNNTVSGDVDLKNEGILFLSIPYSSGWHAIVNGEEVETIRVNTGFVGVPLKEGYSKIDMVYKVPLLKEGAIISVIGILLWGGYIVLLNRRKKNI